jgi:hypothetical protein
VSGDTSERRLPQQPTDQPRGWCADPGSGLDALAPRHSLRSRRGSPASARIRASTARRWLACQARITAHGSRSATATSAASSIWCLPPFLPDSPPTHWRPYPMPAGWQGPAALRARPHPGPFGAAASGLALAIQPVRLVSRHARATKSGRTVAKRQHHPHAAAGKRKRARNLGTRSDERSETCSPRPPTVYRPNVVAFARNFTTLRLCIGQAMKGAS